MGRGSSKGAELQLAGIGAQFSSFHSSPALAERFYRLRKAAIAPRTSHRRRQGPTAHLRLGPFQRWQERSLDDRLNTMQVPRPAKPSLGEQESGHGKAEVLGTRIVFVRRGGEVLAVAYWFCGLISKRWPTGFRAESISASVPWIWRSSLANSAVLRVSSSGLRAHSGNEYN